jgi:2-haloacid dehalogenase
MKLLTPTKPTNPTKPIKPQNLSQTDEPKRLSQKTILFDAYGTLFDVHSIAALLESFFPTQGAALSIALRDTQIAYTRLVTTSNGGAHYRPFDVLTLSALHQVCKVAKLDLTVVQAQAVMAQYQRLSAFDGVKDTLTALKSRGITTGILSNGTPTMLAAATQAAGLTALLDHVLSVHTLNPPQYKTAPRAYGMGTAATQLAAQDIVFVSSNAWDALGATWFGYQTVWLNRTQQPWEALGTLTDTAPHHTIQTIDQLSDLFY